MSDPAATLYVWSTSIPADKPPLEGWGAKPRSFLRGLCRLFGAARSGDDVHLVGFCLAQRARPAFFSLSDDRMPRDHEGKEVALDNAFDVRVFDRDREIRMRRAGNAWRIAVLSENEQAVPAGVPPLGEPTPKTYHRLNDHHYLLWGQRSGREKPRNGWTCLASARIGQLWVPFVDHDGRNGLIQRAREYFTVAEDGNVVFSAERLTGLGGYQRQENETRTSEELAHV